MCVCDPAEKCRTFRTILGLSFDYFNTFFTIRFQLGNPIDARRKVQTGRALPPFLLKFLFLKFVIEPSKKIGFQIEFSLCSWHNLGDAGLILRTHVFVRD